MTTSSSIRSGLLLFVIAITLPFLSDGFSGEDLSALSCQHKCYLTNSTRELMCSQTLPASVKYPLGCDASLIRDGVKITIGNHEEASKIHPNGLSYFGKKFESIRLKSLHLELRLKFDKIEMKPLNEIPQLQRLSLYRLKKDSIDPCLFVDRNFSARISRVKITCMGSGYDLSHPLKLLWPVSKNPPTIRLQNCALGHECYECQGAYKGMVLYDAKGPSLIRSQAKKLLHCHEDGQCPVDLIKRCEIESSTTVATTTTTKPTTLARKTKTDKDSAGEATGKPSIPAAATVDRELVGTKDKSNKNEMYESKKESDGPNLSQLVEALSKRTQRTQRFLIVILVISIINSLVLIALLIYLFRRSRFCCGSGGGKGVYVITKEPPNHPFLDNNGKTT